MSDDKFTPGPWAVFYDHPDIPENIAYIRPASGADYDAHEEIAMVFCCGPETPGSDTARANARLLAAAPDLLEALIWVVRISDRKHDAWDAARAAIAKARGES